MQTYFDAADGDHEVALRHYARNAQFGTAFHGPLQELEVTLRNAMHAQLAAEYGCQWYTAAAPGLDRHARKSIDGLLLHSERDVTPGHFVASMSLGFWVRLVGRGGDNNGGRKADYDSTLWRPALFEANPGRPRRVMQQRLYRLRRLRNRISDNEPILGLGLREDYEKLLEAVGWFSTDVRSWIEAHALLPDALRTPLSEPIRF